MNKSRKSDVCLNCNFTLKESDNFCPNCGQENHDWKVPLKDQIIQFLGDYFTFDSKFFKSTFYLLFKPGFLTNEFNSGRRVKYIPPLRMYIFISIIFFFVARINKNSQIDESPETEKPNKISIGDTSALKDKSGAYFSLGSGNLDVNVGGEQETFTKKMLEESLKDEKKMDAIFDTLKIGKTKFRKFLANVIISQALKLKEQKESFSSYFSSNISIMMFFLMPLFAVLLKLFYIRRKKFYFEHLIFSFHQHSFAFIVLSVSEIFNTEWLYITVVVLILFYLLISMKKVYQQSWRKTIFKYFFSLFSYLICLSVCMAATIFVSFLLF